MPDVIPYLDAVRARLAKRPFDAEYHHPSCRERDLQLIFKCAQCGYEKGAEQYYIDLVRLERLVRVMFTTRAVTSR